MFEFWQERKVVNFHFNGTVWW